MIRVAASNSGLMASPWVLAAARFRTASTVDSSNPAVQVEQWYWRMAFAMS